MLLFSGLYPMDTYFRRIVSQFSHSNHPLVLSPGICTCPPHILIYTGIHTGPPCCPSTLR
jgi:hypothetical protein